MGRGRVPGCPSNSQHRSHAPAWECIKGRSCVPVFAARECSQPETAITTGQSHPARCLPHSCGCFGYRSHAPAWECSQGRSRVPVFAAKECSRPEAASPPPVNLNQPAAPRIVAGASSIVPTLQRGNAARDAPASRFSQPESARSPMRPSPPPVNLNQPAVSCIVAGA